MGFLQRVWRAMKGSDASIPTSLDLWREVYGSSPSHAGVEVTWKSALQVSTVLACTRVMADGVSQATFRPYYEEGGSKRPAVDSPLYDLVNRRPNRWQTSYEFRETLMFHLMLTNNAFVFVNRVGIAREIRELIPIEPGRVAVEQLDDYRLQYKIRAKSGAEQVFAQDAIWHLRGPSWNSWLGMDAMRLAREAIGLSISLERGQADFQRGGAKTSGVYSVEGALSPEKFDFLAKWLDKFSPGGERAGKPMILDLGAKYATLNMSAVDQQLIETRKHQIEEICRSMRVMPLMIGHPADMASRASTESIFLAHVVHGLMPWYVRIEQSADVNLLSDEDRKRGLYFKFNANSLMRGAAKDRAEYYAKALGAGGVKGWMTQNDVRALEDLDLSSDPKANELPQPTGTPPPAAKPQDEPASELDDLSGDDDEARRAA